MTHEMSAVSSGSAQPFALSLSDCVSIYGIGRTRLYELIAAGDIEAKTLGAKTLVMGDSIRAYIASLPRADMRAGQARAAEQVAA